MNDAQQIEAIRLAYLDRRQRRAINALPVVPVTVHDADGNVVIRPVGDWTRFAAVPVQPSGFISFDEKPLPRWQDAQA